MADIEITNYINVSSSRIYEALTTQKGLSETWTRQCDIKQKKGEIHEFGFGDEEPTRFEIQELVPDRKITWLCLESDPEWVGTSVSFIWKRNTKPHRLHFAIPDGRIQPNFTGGATITGAFFSSV